MGSNHSVTRKEIQGYGVVNYPNNEKSMNKTNAVKAVPKLMESACIGKENVKPSNHDLQLATAYLHKYANVGKRRMKTIMKPPVSKNMQSTGESKVTQPEQNSAILPATNTAPTKCENLPNKKVTLTSSHFSMKCLGTFVCVRYLRILPHLTVNEVIMWMKNVDRALTLSGWQDHAFLTTPNITFIYLLARESLPETVRSMNQLKAELLTILYMAYTYSGPEISYPLKPFLIEKNRTAFWTRCCSITNSLSGEMLKINKDSKFYEETQAELASYGCLLQRSAQRG